MRPSFGLLRILIVSSMAISFVAGLASKSPEAKEAVVEPAEEAAVVMASGTSIEPAQEKPQKDQPAKNSEFFS